MMLRVIGAEATAPRGVLLAPNVALLAVPGALPGAAGPGVSLRGSPLLPPYGTIVLETTTGPFTIKALRLPQDFDGRVPLLVERAAGECVTIHADELDDDSLSIASGLDASARCQLLRFLTNFCSAAFHLRRSSAFAQGCMRLALDCARNAGTASVEAQVLPDRILINGIDVPRGAPLAILGDSRVDACPVSTLPSGRLQVVPPVRTNELVVAFGEELMFWTVDAPAAIPHILALPDKEGLSAAQARAVCHRALAQDGSAGAVQLLREIDLLFPAPARKIDDPQQPIGGEVEIGIPDGEGGMFVSGWLRDPLGMVSELSLGTAAGRVQLSSDNLHRVARPDIAKRFATASHRAAERKHGFIAYVAKLPGGQTVQPLVSLHLRSGARIDLNPSPRSMQPAEARDAVLSAVPAGENTPQIMQHCIAPPAARLHRAAMQARRTPDVIRIGRPVSKPVCSILIPIYRNLGFVRFQLGALAEDPLCRRSEVILILDSPEQRSQLEHLLRGLFRVTDLPVTLVVMPQNLGYAAATNAGACQARAPLLLLLNSDVVPVRPGWLKPFLESLARNTVGAAGPKLLFEDDSIQHAGLYFERDEDGIWFSRHYHKGMPRQWMDAQSGREVPGVTGAALAIRRTLFERIGGVCEDYIIGDYEDSDLCLKVRAAGAAICYVPEAELYHFERRSIALHAGYSRTHASLYNRLLHHSRWNNRIAALMGESAPGRRRRSS